MTPRSSRLNGSRTGAAEQVHGWTIRLKCSAAPVRDPFSRELLGVIDVTGGDHLATPVSLSLVHATALAVEGELTRLHAARPAGRRADDPATARLELLGRDEGRLVLGPDERRLSRRHSEILALLVDRPAGLTGEQLGIELYGDNANPITLRAEMVRLRKLLGPDLLGSRPYRLLGPMVADFTEVRRLLGRGSVEAALRHYRGPLLPASEAPGVERIRWTLEQQARAALLATTDPAPLLHWTSTAWGREARTASGTANSAASVHACVRASCRAAPSGAVLARCSQSSRSSRPRAT